MDCIHFTRLLGLPWHYLIKFQKLRILRKSSENWDLFLEQIWSSSCDATGGAPSNFKTTYIQVFLQKLKTDLPLASKEYFIRQNSKLWSLKVSHGHLSNLSSPCRLGNILAFTLFSRQIFVYTIILMVSRTTPSQLNSALHLRFHFESVICTPNEENLPVAPWQEQIVSFFWWLSTWPK